MLITSLFSGNDCKKSKQELVSTSVTDQTPCKTSNSLNPAASSLTTPTHFSVTPQVTNHCGNIKSDGSVPCTVSNSHPDCKTHNAAKSTYPKFKSKQDSSTGLWKTSTESSQCPNTRFGPVCNQEPSENSASVSSHEATLQSGGMDVSCSSDTSKYDSSTCSVSSCPCQDVTYSFYPDVDISSQQTQQHITRVQKAKRLVTLDIFYCMILSYLNMCFSCSLIQFFLCDGHMLSIQFVVFVNLKICLWTPCFISPVNYHRCLLTPLKCGEKEVAIMTASPEITTLQDTPQRDHVLLATDAPPPPPRYRMDEQLCVDSQVYFSSSSCSRIMEVY